MKFLLKLALAVCLISLSTSFTSVLAQTTDIDSVDSPTTVNLNSVFIVNNQTNTNNDLRDLNAWAVGDSGIILQWNGNSWSTVSSPTSVNLYSVCFDSPYDGWAVGGGANSGVILRYDGTWSVWNSISFSGFTDEMDTINSTLYSVTLDTGGMTGWIVGAGGVALTWDGTTETWFGFTGVSANTLRSVAMIHDSPNAWAVGDGGTIVHWNGNSWTSMTSPTNHPLYTIQMIDATTAWAGGGSNNNGVVLMMDGTTWTVWDEFVFGMDGEVVQTLNSTIYSISMGSDEAAWGVGGNGFVMYFTGTEWACNDNVVPGALKGVSMVHGSDVGSIQAWAVGDTGAIIAFNGTAWVPELPLFAVPLLLSIGLVVALLGRAKLSKLRRIVV